MRIEAIRGGTLHTEGPFPELRPGWNEIILCTAGDARIIAGGVGHKVYEGDAIFIPSNLPHRVRPSRDWACSVVRFADQQDSHNQPMTIDALQIYPDADGHFRKLFDLAATAQLEGNDGLDAFLYALGGAIYHLLQHCRATQRQSPNAAVEQISRQIRRNFADPEFDLAAEIEATGYCESHFRRIFKLAYGRPPQQQLNFVRIEHAKMQLLRTEASIREVALLSGFRDPYYFSRKFRQFEGCSPTEYLERLAAAGGRAG